MRLSEIKHVLPDLTTLTQTGYLLRDQPTNPSEFQQVIELANTYLRQIMQEPKMDAEVLIFIHGYLGNAYRIANQPNKAIQSLQKALEICRFDEDERGELRTLIRLGEAYKYADEHEMALQYFEQALILSRTEELYDYKDFALQHMGKCLMELGEYDHALKRFEEALDLRKNKGNDELILSTETAIIMTHILKGNGTVQVAE